MAPWMLGFPRQTAREAMADLYRTLPEAVAWGWIEEAREEPGDERLEDGVRDPWASRSTPAGASVSNRGDWQCVLRKRTARHCERLLPTAPAQCRGCKDRFRPFSTPCHRETA